MTLTGRRVTYHRSMVALYHENVRAALGIARENEGPALQRRHCISLRYNLRKRY